MSSIILQNIDKAYGKNAPVIENLNLEIKDKSFTVLLGPSGCGKSTILRMIAGLEAQTSGTILFDDEDMTNVPPENRDIAFVFQNYALYPTMTVRGNIEFGLKNRKIPKAEIAARVEEVCSLLDISEYLNRKPQNLSGGQRQRVALARAMVKKPDIFLMDEPLSNLDAKLRNQIRTDLIALHKRLNTTFVYVTHDQVEAMSMATDIVLLNKGKVMQMSSPAEMYKQPRNVFSAKFIGTPAMNVISSGKSNISVPQGCAYVGFRPENVMLEKKNNDDFCISCDVASTEMLGAETVIKALSGDEIIFMRAFTSACRPEGRQNFYVERANLCYFNEQEERIYE